MSSCGVGGDSDRLIHICDPMHWKKARSVSPLLKISLPNRVVIEGIENKGLGRWGSDRTGSGERTNEARTNERTNERSANGSSSGAHTEGRVDTHQPVSHTTPPSWNAQPERHSMSLVEFSSAAVTPREPSSRPAAPLPKNNSSPPRTEKTHTHIRTGKHLHRHPRA